MSEKWTIVIPEDPEQLLDKAVWERARDWFLGVAPDAEETEIITRDFVDFFDAGGNFERIYCPACGTEVPLSWWQDRMDDDFEDPGFRLAKYALPCCGTSHTLHQLAYEWPIGFGRNALEVMNPGIGRLSDAQIRELKEILGTPVRIIYKRI